MTKKEEKTELFSIISHVGLECIRKEQYEK